MPLQSEFSSDRRRRAVMSDRKIGIWLIGAWGKLATSVAVGLATVQRELLDRSMLVSEQPRFSQLDLADWSQFVAVGGHEIRRTSLYVEARHLSAGSPAIAPEVLAQIEPELAAFDRNVRTGTLINVGTVIESQATTAALKLRSERPGAAVKRIAADIQGLAGAQSLEHVIVFNLASMEPPMAENELDRFSWADLQYMLEEGNHSPLPASTLYAIAALRSGCSYINFTPSFGSDLPALRELALITGTLLMGRDGKPAGGALTGTPLLDLARFCERERRRGKSGVMTFLSEFFQSPMQADGDKASGAADALDRWLADVSREM